MTRSIVALLLLGAAVAGCSAARPDSFQQSDADQCYRPRSFTDEIPRMYWGDPVRDPCWRFRRVVPDR